MIVKNEAHVLPRTLQMLCTYFNFSYWVISDTGSTDGTQELIRTFFAGRGISGELIETPWKNFGHNRTVALQAAYNKSDYVFVWDADDSIVGNFRLPEKLQGDVYEFEFGAPGEFKYSRMQLFNNRKRWKYVGVLHEHPAPEEAISGITHVTGAYHFVSGREGSRNKDPDKYKKDAAILEEGLREEPENARYAFYCGNSYMGAQDYENALRMYKRVLTRNGWSEEKYMSCISGFNCYENLGRAEEGLYMLVDAGRYSPERVDAAFYLIKYYANRDQNKPALMYYSQVQEHYEANHASMLTSRFLFANHHDYVFYLPYYMMIVALKLDKHELALKMFDIILHHRYTLVPPFYIRCLFQNFFVIKDVPPSLSRLQAILDYRSQLSEEGFEEIQNAAIGRYIDICRGQLTSHTSYSSVNKESPTVFFSITSCKRFDLFKQTMNSILNTWADRSKIDYFFCVDDASTEEDRCQMKELYPFFDFYMKTDAEKGHRTSMNIIWKKLQTLRPTYWIHMEDDFLFFYSDMYITKSMALLDKHASANIHQILFNRNYAETYKDWNLVGGCPLEPGYTTHEIRTGISERNCAYWPHYSFRPSMVRVDRIIELGNYDSANIFFERDYADRWASYGYKSAFFNRISCLHIGKLTSETGDSAYSLNEQRQW